MSETNNQTKPELSNKEKIEFMKAMFASLEIDEQAELTQYFHEEVEKGGSKFLGKKMQEVNDKMTDFIAKAYDQTKKGAKFIYDKGNEMFENKEEKESNSPNTSKGSGIWD